MLFKPEFIPKIESGEKTVTRRNGTREYKPGQVVAIQPGRGKRGVGFIKIISVNEVFLYPIWQDELRREGLSDLTPFGFVKLFYEVNRITRSDSEMIEEARRTVITRIEFTYIGKDNQTKGAR